MLGHMAAWQYMLLSMSVSFLLFFAGGGTVHWWYYKKNKDKASDWKIQPGKFLSDKLNREAFWLAVFNLACSSALYGFIFWGILERGWSQLYWDFNAHSIAYAALSFFLAWLVIEAGAYYLHAIMHFKPFYKGFHGIHHRYSAPNYYTIISMHPLEWPVHSLYVLAPAFLFPLYGPFFFFFLGLVYVLGFWDHCGIKLFRIPLHGSNKFHDDHHKYFHVNFGFTVPWFDMLHKTIRREGRHYTERTFLGDKGILRDPGSSDQAVKY